MIQSFSCADTRTLFEMGHSQVFATVEHIARRKLQQLDCAATLEALRAPYSNEFETAIVECKTRHSICLHGTWHLCFAWRDDGPSQVAIENIQDLGESMLLNNLPPTHPGEVLREDYLVPLGMSASTLAQALHVPFDHVQALLQENRPIDPEMALRLAHYFGGDAQSWMNLQHSYDLKLTEKAVLQSIINTIQPVNFVNRHLMCKS